MSRELYIYFEHFLGDKYASVLNIWNTTVDKIHRKIRPSGRMNYWSDNYPNYNWKVLGGVSIGPYENVL